MLIVLRMVLLPFDGLSDLADVDDFNVATSEADAVRWRSVWRDGRTVDGIFIFDTAAVELVGRDLRAGLVCGIAGRAIVGGSAGGREKIEGDGGGMMDMTGAYGAVRQRPKSESGSRLLALEFATAGSRR